MSSGGVDQKFSNYVSAGDWEDPFEPLKVSLNDYFRGDCRLKALHFFVPCSFELKILPLEGSRHEWQSV